MTMVDGIFTLCPLIFANMALRVDGFILVLGRVGCIKGFLGGLVRMNNGLDAQSPFLNRAIENLDLISSLPIENSTSPNSQRLYLEC